MKFTIANALTIIDKYKVENTKKMGMTFNKLCNSCTNVDAIPKSEYEARLKDDMAAMLTEIQLEIEELEPLCNECDYAINDCTSKAKVNDIIQQKINKLKEKNNDL